MADTTQNRLLHWAAAFLFLYSTILTLSPAARERTWDVDYRLSHWAGFAIWFAVIFILNRAISRQVPDRDPYLFPAAALLSGWGVLTIWRLDEAFGLRQAVWLAVSALVFVLGLWRPQTIGILRRYKYVLLGGGLLITALTLILGTNPGGFGPRLWLGCCGVYFQPSEPLKLLLVVYLAAYFADRLDVRLNVFLLLLPTLIVTGLALLLLLVQRDLGTASIFILIYTIMLFLTTGRRCILLASAAGLAVALLIGFAFVGIIQIRVGAWLDPWADPAGNSYQIIQSLLAVANGGTTGRGPGLGSPGLVPVAISDFIFSAIAEETGLAGTIGLLALIWLILARGLIAALRAPDRFRRFLAAGVTTYLGVQSLLIIGGNLRVLPLTGVTLPFVSYGGSSLLTSYIALLILILIGGDNETEPAALPDHRPYALLSGLLGIGLAVTALTAAWWAIIRGPDLLTRTDNPRRSIADRYVPRGSLLDQNSQPINITEGRSGSYTRSYVYADLGPISGYTHPIFGQAGLEASLDEYLRGLQGNPASLIWWDHLLYGMPPPGLDVRLSIDLNLQSRADQLLGEHAGAIILMNSQTGEILSMASHPAFDPNRLDEEGALLSQNPNAPLVNRAAQGLYPIGTAALPLIRAQFNETKPSDSDLLNYYRALGFSQSPELNLPVASGVFTASVEGLRVSPLQMGLAASALSNHGVIPAPRIAMAVNTPEQGWVVLPALGQSINAIQATAADESAQSFIAEGQAYWEHLGQASLEESVVTWVIAGTLPDWHGTPLTLVITLEEDNVYLARFIADEILAGTLTP